MAASQDDEGSTTGAASVLLIDDDPGVLRMLRRELKRKGILTEVASSAEEGLRRLSLQSFPVLVCDQLLPKMTGIELLKQVKSQEGGLTEVILLTGHGGIDDAVEAMRCGAFHYLTKPVRVAELATVIQNAHGKAALLRENLLLRRAVEGTSDLASSRPMIGESAAWRRVLHLIERSAGTASTVLITGRSGTGKELVARAIHRLSGRSHSPFVAINSASVVASLLESELFGHEAGAFTGAAVKKRGLFELADGGTLFLDEIGETSAEFQAKLLRVLETGEYWRVGGTQILRADVRLLAATNRTLKSEVEAGRFREDLFYRLNVLNIELPELRERGEDIGLLAEHFLALCGRGRAQRFSEGALAVLKHYPWPGNVRELRNVVERLSILCDRDTIEVVDLAADIVAAAEEVMRAPPEPEASYEGGEGTPAPLSEVERHHIIRVLDFSQHNKTRAARILGVTPATLYNKLKLYKSQGLWPEEEGGQA